MALAGAQWQKSSYSGTQTECVEVALWSKSSHSGSQGECVEVAVSPRLVAVRDTKDRTGGTLTLPAPAWTAFLTVIPA